MSEDNDISQLERRLLAAKRLLAIREAKDNMLAYAKLSMPDPNDPDNPDMSQYEVTPQGRMLCEIIEKVERGELKRVAVSIGPQLGKSEILSRKGPAWIAGKKPSRNLMLGSYNQDFANEFGDDVKNIIESDFHKQVFPEHVLRKKAADLLITADGGKSAFVGVGGSGTGKPADFFFVDDPIRNDDDAQSQLYRDRQWAWFNRVVFTRCHAKSAIVVVHTRWHQDDLIGRLCDPEHPERKKKYAGIADRWTYINLPAVVDDPQLAAALGLTLEEPEDDNVKAQFGTKPMSALWPNRKSLPFLAEAKQMDEHTFSSLYMGRPTPEDGTYFAEDMFVPYQREELPQNLRMYGASDHAVSEKQDRDYTVLGCVGVDEEKRLWVLPDLVWERMETNRTVDELLAKFKTHNPLLWWMEDELISKSFGPFLHERMIEESIYCAIDPVRPTKDKKTRARAVQGLMQLGRIRFPVFAPWWSDARSQMINFPYGTNDDFVDWLAHIGMGIRKELGAAKPAASNDNAPTGSIQWILKAAKARAQIEKRKAANAGW